MLLLLLLRCSRKYIPERRRRTGVSAETMTGVHMNDRLTTHSIILTNQSGGVPRVNAYFQPPMNSSTHAPLLSISSGGEKIYDNDLNDLRLVSCVFTVPQVYFHPFI